MSLNGQANDAEKLYEDVLRRVSEEYCRPESYQTVLGGPYDSLIVAREVHDVRLQNVTVLTDVVIRGSYVFGTIYVPVGITIDLGGNNVTVYNLSWHQLAQRQQLA